MLDRRSFLHFSMATGVGLHTAVCHSLDCLGQPRSWSLVPEGCHPISPERVIVVAEKGGDGWPSRVSRLEVSLRSAMSDPYRLHASCGLPTSVGNFSAEKSARCPRCGYHWTATPHVPDGKQNLIMRLMQVMTGHYRVPHLFPRWTTALAKREALGATAAGGFGLLHQFQNQGVLELANPPVDWWLILFPEGCAWQAWDDKPVFAMVAHMFPPNHCEMPGLAMRAWCLSSAVGRRLEPAAWAHIARLDRMAAILATHVGQHG